MHSESGLRAKRARTGRLATYASSIVRLWRFKLLFANALCGLLPDFASGALRTRLYRLAGFKIGHGAFISGNMNLIGGTDRFYENLTIGRGTNIANHVTVNLDGLVTLGANVSLGPYVLIYTGTHQIGPGSNRRRAEVLAKPVTIDDGCWIGLAAIILPGVTIGHGSIVAAGAVVAQDIPPDSYVEGNPAQVVRQLPWGNR